MKLALQPITRWLSSTAAKDKLVVVMGVTGAGKSRLSVDLASRFPAEIINSDKIQVYRGLDITTNKITVPDRAGVPHHLLGYRNSPDGDLSPAQYRRDASSAISDIHSRRRLPLLVGGSNSLIYSLLSNRNSDPFSSSDPILSESNLRYRCCFLWVDVSPPVLNEYLDKRVNDMLESGMVEELAKYYLSSEINQSAPGTGLRKAIGVPEFERYFQMLNGGDNDDGTWGLEKVQRSVYEEAVRWVKENTRELARRQREKIVRLGNAGWGLRRMDGSDAFRGVLEGSDGWRCEWERQVVEPSVKIVRRFLEE